MSACLKHIEEGMMPDSSKPIKRDMMCLVFLALLPLALSVPLSGCKSPENQLKGSNAYVYLNRTNEWRFGSKGRYGDFVTIRVTGYTDIEGITYAVWDEVYHSPKGEEMHFPRLFRYGEQGEILHLPSHKPEHRKTLFPFGVANAAKPMYKTEAKVGDTWEVQEPALIGLGLATVKAELVSREDSAVIGTETIRHCLHFKFNKGTLSYDDWLAPGIGLVKRTYFEGGIDSLVSYRLH